MNLFYNPATAAQLQSFTQNPGHAVLLLGPKGSGKMATARQLAADMLAIPLNTIDSHAYVRIVVSDKAVSIDDVRSIEQFVRLKVPSKRQIQRIIIVDQADTMTIEAQNALLKTLEEPPEGTVIILLGNNSQALIPTVRSRLQVISIKRVARDEVCQYFKGEGHSEAAVDRAYGVSGGLPGLMHALLTQDDHPLSEAITLGRSLLQETTYERLLHVDALSKQKPLVENTLFIMQQMAHACLQTAEGKTAERWQQVMRASYEAADLLHNQAQPKLVLDQLMLRLG